jgi:hypothetical protein
VIINYLDSSLRVETLSFEEAADFNPQEWFMQFLTIKPRPTTLAGLERPAHGLVQHQPGRG